MSTLLTVSSERQSVVFLPVSIARTSSDFVMQMTLSKTTVLTARCSQPTKLTVLMDSLAEPVDSGVPTDDLVLGVHHYHLKELVDRIFPNPVGVEHTKATAVATSSFLMRTYKYNIVMIMLVLVHI